MGPRPVGPLSLPLFVMSVFVCGIVEEMNIGK
ncbi:hypothetical protein LINGRAHAP2_LOCUS13193 [Linum grandiflorum]